MESCVLFILVATILLRLSYQLQCEDQRGGPILTRITDPVAQAEGPHWDDSENVLYYVDIPGGGVYRYDPATKNQHHITFDQPVSIVLPLKNQKYKFVITLGLEIVVLTWDWESNFHAVSPLVSVKNSPAARFNDGKADAKGRIWTGTIGQKNAAGDIVVNKSALYRVDNNPTIPCHADTEVSPVTISNGLAWTADNKVFYYIDTPTRRVDAFNFDLASGTISNRRTVFRLGNVEGNPDGMTIDTNGNLWIACARGFQVIHVNPTTGQLLRQIKFPVQMITSVVFGGPKLDILYVTTSRVNLTPEQLRQQPLAGSVWEVTGLNTTGTLSKPAVVNCPLPEAKGAAQTNQGTLHVCSSAQANRGRTADPESL